MHELIYSYSDCNCKALETHIQIWKNEDTRGKKSSEWSTMQLSTTIKKYLQRTGDAFYKKILNKKKITKLKKTSKVHQSSCLRPDRYLKLQRHFLLYIIKKKEIHKGSTELEYTQNNSLKVLSQYRGKDSSCVVGKPAAFNIPKQSSLRKSVIGHIRVRIPGQDAIKREIVSFCGILALPHHNHESTLSTCKLNSILPSHQ